MIRAPGAGRRLNRHPFSLVEILVVIGVIAIMTSMLMAVVSKSRERARFTRWLAFSADMEKDEDLVGHWRFLADDYKDQSVSNHARALGRKEYHQGRFDGVPTGLHVWARGRYTEKWALSFSMSGYLSTGGHLQDLTESFSAVAWVKVPAGVDFTVCSQGAGMVPIRIEDLVLKAELDGTEYDSGLPVPRGKWTHVAVVHDAEFDTIFLYVNGQVHAVNGTDVVPFTDVVAPFRIGNTATGDAGAEEAWVDELAIYERALTEAQIRDMVSMGKVD